MLCLVYNTTGEPIELVPSLIGLVLHLRGKEGLERVLRKHRRIRSRVAALTNEHLFLRDGHRCGYCGRHRRELGDRERLTRDHLVPRSKGGADRWDNVVTACSSCNHAKDCRLVAEVGRKPIRIPWVPTRQELVLQRLRGRAAVA